jgi:hypothetical protein
MHTRSSSSTTWATLRGTYRVDNRALLGGHLARNRTSCEAKNLFLDRALIVDTVGQTGAGFF